MKISKRLLLILIVLASCVGCDQVSKSIAVTNLPDGQTFSYLGDTLRLQFMYNRGSFLSLGDSLPDALRFKIFTIGVCFLLAGILAYALFSRPGRFTVLLAVSLFLAGGVGNLIDRIFHDGLVVDFINIGIGPLRTGIFNIADVAIMVGYLLLFYSVFQKQPVAQEKASPATG